MPFLLVPFLTVSSLEFRPLREKEGRMNLSPRLLPGPVPSPWGSVRQSSGAQRAKECVVPAGDQASEHQLPHQSRVSASVGGLAEGIGIGAHRVEK